LRACRVERDMDLVMGCVERIAVVDRGTIIAAGAFNREACAQYVVPGGPQNLTAIPVGGSRIISGVNQPSEHGETYHRAGGAQISNREDFGK
jgi:hypothetical protein